MKLWSGHGAAGRLVQDGADDVPAGRDPQQGHLRLRGRDRHIRRGPQKPASELKQIYHISISEG